MVMAARTTRLGGFRVLFTHSMERTVDALCSPPAVFIFFVCSLGTHFTSVILCCGQV